MINPQSEASTQLTRKDSPCQHKAEIQQELESLGSWGGLVTTGQSRWSPTNDIIQPPELRMNGRQSFEAPKNQVIPIDFNLFATSSTVTI